ncbi:MAG: calnexin [Piptocephalis tieghemiana]|nr:MAG: calnexin [Piptocephalis tieghemiana]
MGNLSRAFVLSLLASSALAADADLTSSSKEPMASPSTYVAPNVKGHFVEDFEKEWKSLWIPSSARKDEEFQFSGKWEVEDPTVLAPGKGYGHRGLVLKTPAAHHGISAKFDEPLDNTDKTLVVQYEAKMQNGLECGGAYLKLLSKRDGEDLDSKDLSDKTPYTVMFGPDRCGSTNKVHFIFRRQNPKTKEYEEKHLVSPPVARTDTLSNLYTLIIRQDNTYEILINRDTVSSGNLLKDFTPPVNPPAEIRDPKDTKPSDWVDDAKIPDPEAKKPEDWDESAPARIPDPEAKMPEDWLVDAPQEIKDPKAQKPDDWDEEEDGEWEAPLIPNPKCEEASGCGPWTPPMIVNPAYKGPWTAPSIDNPAYKGEWEARMIPNPDYYEDKHPANLDPMIAVGFELWTMQSDILFDNLYIGHSEEEAKTLAETSWRPKHEAEKKLEEASKPPTPESEDPLLGDQNVGPVFLKDPVGFLRHHLSSFADQALKDPLQAILEAPLVAAGLLGTMTLFLIALLAISGGSGEEEDGASGSDASRGKDAAGKSAGKKKNTGVTEDSEGNEGDNEETADEGSTTARKAAGVGAKNRRKA